MDANMNTESKEVVFELESSLRELAAPEVELLLLHCYYVTSEKQLTKGRAAEKKKEYDLYKKSFTQDSIQKVKNVYNEFHDRFPYFYGAVYNYAHKSDDYKHLLMLI